METNPYVASGGESTLLFDTANGIITFDNYNPGGNLLQIDPAVNYGFFSESAFFQNNGSWDITPTTISAGTVLDASSSWNPSYYAINPDSNVSNAYLGLRIGLGSGNYDYGWIEYSTGSALSSYGPSSITVTAVAFDTTPNEAVVAAGAVPEPSTYAIFGLGAAGLAIVNRARIIGSKRS